jgi:hypothetical protein
LVIINKFDKKINQFIIAPSKGEVSGMRMIYEKKNGDILQRTVTNSPYKIGDVNAYGWKVIDIKYLYKDKYYSSSEYDNLMRKSWSKDRKISELKRKLTSVYKELIYIVMILILLRLYEVVSSTIL